MGGTVFIGCVPAGGTSTPTHRLMMPYNFVFLLGRTDTICSKASNFPYKGCHFVGRTDGRTCTYLNSKLTTFVNNNASRTKLPFMIFPGKCQVLGLQMRATIFNFYVPPFIRSTYDYLFVSTCRDANESYYLQFSNIFIV